MTTPETPSPWMDPSRAPLERANRLLAALSFEQKVQMALAAASDEGRALLGPFAIPDLELRDGPCGIRGEEGVTAFPSSQALAATFDRELAAAFGAAVGEEMRAKGANTWLGPGVDIARTPLAGRQAEALGEDPYLAGQIAAAEVFGLKPTHVISMLKHYAAYNQEWLRTGYSGGRPFSKFSPATNVIVSEKALQEIYYPPVKAAIEAGTTSVMTSYNRINGILAGESPAVMGALLAWGWRGFAAPDFGHAIRDPLQAAQVGLDLPALSEKEPAGRTAGMFTSGQISAERLDDICRRLLYAKFEAGLFDHPAKPARAEASTPEHLALAQRIAEASMVLLKNDGPVLPLPERAGLAVAVIGPAGDDVLWTIGGSAAVTIAPGRAVKPLDAIRARVEAADGTVTFAQGSLGDMPLPALPEGVLRTPEGAPGLLGRYWEGLEPQGLPVLERVDERIEDLKKPESLGGPWSARWTGTLTPAESGLYRFSLLVGGIVQVYIDEQLVASGYREAPRFFHGPMVPVQGAIYLQAGAPAAVRIEYNSGGAIRGGEISLGWQPPEASLLGAAVEAARRADYAVVFVTSTAGEGMDRATLALPGDQDALIAAVAAANPRTVVVINSGGPVFMPWLGQVEAVLQAWYPGERYGAAEAAVLLGEADPGGRLPVTFPANEGQGPAPATRPERYPGVNLDVEYSEGVLVGYRWYDQYGQEPLFPFGHGLSYAVFEWSDLQLEAGAGGTVSARVTVRNTSERAGDEVVQLYVGMPEACGEPPAQLKGFEKVRLGPGESRGVAFTLDEQALSVYDEGTGGWRRVPGEYRVWVGPSSRRAMLEGTVRIS